MACADDPARTLRSTLSLVPSVYSAHFRRLLRGCLLPDVKLRLQPSQILRHRAVRLAMATASARTSRQRSRASHASVTAKQSATNSVGLTTTTPTTSRDPSAMLRPPTASPLTSKPPTSASLSSSSLSSSAVAATTVATSPSSSPSSATATTTTTAAAQATRADEFSFLGWNVATAVAVPPSYPLVPVGTGQGELPFSPASVAGVFRGYDDFLERCVQYIPEEMSPSEALWSSDSDSDSHSSSCSSSSERSGAAALETEADHAQSEMGRHEDGSDRTERVVPRPLSRRRSQRLPSSLSSSSSSSLSHTVDQRERHGQRRGGGRWRQSQPLRPRRRRHRRRHHRRPRRRKSDHSVADHSVVATAQATEATAKSEEFSSHADGAIDASWQRVHRSRRSQRRAKD